MKLVFLALSLVGALGALIVTPPASCAQTTCATGYICQFEICIPASLFDCNPACLGSQFCVPGHQPFCAELFPECTPACGEGSFCTWDDASTGTTKCQNRDCETPCSTNEFCVMGSCTSSCAVCPLLNEFTTNTIGIMANASSDVSKFVNIMSFDFKNVASFDGTVSGGVLAQFDKESTFDIPVVAMTNGIADVPSAILIGDMSNAAFEILALKNIKGNILLGAGANATIASIMMDDAMDLYIAADSEWTNMTNIAITEISSITLGSKSTLHINGEMRVNIERVNATFDASINFCGGPAVTGEIASGVVTLNSEQGAVPAILVPTSGLFTVNGSVIGSVKSFIDIAGNLELGGMNSLVSIDIEVLTGGQLTVTSNAQITGAVNLNANSAILIDISNGASAPFFGWLETCVEGSTIFFVVDDVTKGGQRVILSYNSNTQPAAFACDVVLVDGKGKQVVLPSTVQTGTSRRLLANDCVNQAIWDNNALSYTVCGSGNAASTNIVSSLFVTLLVVISSFISL